MEIVLAYDGDVMKFAGDSVIVAFYPAAAERSASDAGLQAATARCARCAAALIEHCGALSPVQAGPVHFRRLYREG